MAPRPRIALVGEDAPVLAAYLDDLGYELVRGATVAQALRPADGQGLDLMVLRVGRNQDGALDDVRTARDHGGDAAILVLTAGHDLVSSIAGLETGADDVVAEPVEPQEVAARIAGILERRGVGRRDVLRFERTAVDLGASRLLRPGERPERLGPGEVVLLRALARHPRQVLSRDALMDMAPAESLDANDRSIDTRVARLRRKLDTDAIVTVRGHGYMYVPPFDKGD